MDEEIGIHARRLYLVEREHMQARSLHRERFSPKGEERIRKDDVVGNVDRHPTKATEPLKMRTITRSDHPW